MIKGAIYQRKCSDPFQICFTTYDFQVQRFNYCQFSSPNIVVLWPALPIVGDDSTVTAKSLLHQGFSQKMYSYGWITCQDLDEKEESFAGARQQQEATEACADSCDSRLSSSKPGLALLFVQELKKIST